MLIVEDLAVTCERVAPATPGAFAVAGKCEICEDELEKWD
jgi:hypothetical protein